MNPVHAKITQEQTFYSNTNPVDLIERYGSPLYVYNENILRQRCRELKNVVRYPRFTIHYAIKANSNVTLLKIIRDERLNVDAVSSGEIYLALKAGFTPEQVLYTCNNVSAEELKFAIETGVNVSVDSLSQLELFGKISQPGSRVVVRFNLGIGAGHHQKIVTGGKKTKFGLQREFIPKVKEILKKHNLRLIGINQHIGSLFMEEIPYIEAAKSLLSIAKQFDDLELIDMGGGFGISYHDEEKEKRFNLEELGQQLDQIIAQWVKDYGKKVAFKAEPGRYIVAECGVLLGTVYATKINYGRKYIGTDLGFNVLMRPSLYDAYHGIEIYRKAPIESSQQEHVIIVGNICESGDIIADGRLLPEISEGDIIGILDAGAYGYSMSSNYNSRLRPAEVLIKKDGEDVLIRSRETFEDLIRNVEV